MKWTFIGHKAGPEATVEAPDERLARREAMCVLHGRVKDSVTPHAPLYNGIGLILLGVKR